MISEALLAVLLAAADPVGAAVADAAPSATSLGNEKIALSLKDADLRDVLEKLATLMNVTPIFAPGIGGSVTMAVDAPVPEILRTLESSFHISIRVADGRMLVSSVQSTPLPLDDAAVDERYLADTSLPRRPAYELPVRFQGVAEFRMGAGSPIAFSLERAGTISVPGCQGSLALFTVPGDRFDGLPSLILVSEGPLPGVAPPVTAEAGSHYVFLQALPRVISPTLGETLQASLPACASSLSVRLMESSKAAGVPRAITPSGRFVIEARIVEVRAGGGEEVLTAPKVWVEGGAGAAVQSGSRRPSSRGPELEQVIQLGMIVTDSTDATATIVVAASVLRDVDPKEGGPRLTVRVARARESARIEFGKSRRIVLAPTYGRGDSALVLDLVVNPARLP